ncbi:three component ABC system middle component, partial [Clostridium botulinum]
DFPKRAGELVLITNEAVELLLHVGLLQLTNNGELEIVKTVKALSKTKYTNDEIKDCIKKSEHIAKWFAATGRVETIFISLGVRP